MSLSSSAKLLTNASCCGWYGCLQTTLYPRFMGGQIENGGGSIWKGKEGLGWEEDKRSTNQVLAEGSMWGFKRGALPGNLLEN